MNIEVREYLRGKGIDVSKTSGKELVVSCWWCGADERKRKLYVSQETGCYSCKVCSNEGGWRRILEFFGDDDEKADVFRPSRKLAIYNEYVTVCQDILFRNKATLTYLYDRGLTKETIEEARLGYHPKGQSIVQALPSSLQAGGFTRDELRDSGLLTVAGRDFHQGRLIIPYVSSGQVLQVRGRALDPAAKAKYQTPPGDPVRLYNSDALRGADSVICVEGEIDCLTLKQTLSSSPDVRARNVGVVAIPGAQVLPDGKEGFATHFEDIRRVYVGLDNDNAGKQGAIKVKDLLGAKGRIVELTETVDWNEYLADGTRGWMNVMGLIAEADMRGKRVFTVAESAHKLRAIETGKPGIKLGFASLDAFLKPGLMPGQVTVPLARTGDGKALALDTPILTVGGWVTMADLQTSDKVYGPDGIPIRVLVAGPVQQHRPCYAVTFSDGARIVADAEHEWTVDVWRSPTCTLTTREMATTYLNSYGRRLYSVRGGALIQVSPPVLPIDPYILGYWLGDGCSRNPSITCGGEDIPNLLLQLEEAGFRRSKVRRTNTAYIVTASSGPDLDADMRVCLTCGLEFSVDQFYGRANGAYQRDCKRCVTKSIRDRRAADKTGAHYCSPRKLHPSGPQNDFMVFLRENNLLRNKHVPEIYLRGSVEQRLALLQGMMDSDGYAASTSQVEFCSINKSLAEAVCELARSLGYKVGPIMVGRATLNGRDCGAKYRVLWTAFSDMNPFRLPRKAKRLKPRAITNSTRTRTIVSIEPVESVPVRCIQVDRQDGLYLAGRELVPTHNSVWLANVAWNTRHLPTLFITLEMTAAETYTRLRRIAHFYEPTFDEPDIWAAFPQLGIVEENRLTSEDFNILIEEYAEERGDRPQLVFVDYLGYFARGQRGRDQYERMTNAIMQLKEESKRHELHIIAPGQVGRGLRPGEPINEASARDAGTVEETADFMFGLYRPWDAHADVAQPGSVNEELKANILKSRHGNKGRVCSLAMSFASLAIVDSTDRLSVNRIQMENTALNRGETYAEIYKREREKAWAAQQGRLNVTNGKEAASG